MRQSLNVESGLNDGICVPLLLIVLATVSGAGGESHPVRVLAEEIGYGLLGGVAAGVLAAAIVIVAGGRRLIDDAWRQIIPVAAAVLAYGIAVDLGGSGFIAAFVAGALFGLIARDDVASSDAASRRRPGRRSTASRSSSSVPCCSARRLST